MYAHIKFTYVYMLLICFSYASHMPFICFLYASIAASLGFGCLQHALGSHGFAPASFIDSSGAISSAPLRLEKPCTRRPPRLHKTETTHLRHLRHLRKCKSTYKILQERDIRRHHETRRHKAKLEKVSDACSSSFKRIPKGRALIA